MFESVRISTRGELDAMIVGVFKPKKGDVSLDKATASLDKSGAIAAVAARAECTGDIGSLAEAFPTDGPAPRVLVAGLGAEEDFRSATLRAVAGAVGRRLAQTRDEKVGVSLAGAVKQGGVDERQAGRAFGEGVGLVAFRFDEFRGQGSEDRKPPKLALRADSDAFEKGLKMGLALAESTNISRRCSATPPNVATPAWMASQARAMARGVDSLSVRVVQGEALEKEKLVGLTTVGRASANPPCLIRIEYKPSGAASQKPAVLLGKTITYDTGGLSLKIQGGMRGMKGDKDGGCAVLGAMHAIATVIKPKRRVVGLLVAAENSVSDDAYRPDDIMTFRNGVSVEVTNTDAEGRLVLADGLCWAAEKEKAEFIVDIATLTGGVVTALGSTYAGMWCDDDTLRGRVEAAAERAGERVWRLPLHQEYRDLMRSSVADIVNSAPVRKAHPIQGAAFLSYFVDQTPWCHLDIAGVHNADSDFGPFVKEAPTGFGVRLLASLFE